MRVENFYFGTFVSGEDAEREFKKNGDDASFVEVGKADAGSEKIKPNSNGDQNLASTVVNDKGIIIDHKDDGDDNIYLNRRGGNNSW